MSRFKEIVGRIGNARMVIALFFLFLCAMCLVYGLPLGSYLGNSISRLPMEGVIVLAMVPGILCGIGLNFGVTIGLIAGLLGMTVSIELGLSGFAGIFTAMLIGALTGTVFGILYGMALNKLKGSEMTVATYVGFSVVALMNIGWLLLPFNSPSMAWPMGNGLRNTIELGDSFGEVFDDFLSVQIGGYQFPTGNMLFFLLMCLLLWLFLRSKTGIAMKAAGDNPRFAEASGINVNRMRIIGTMLSTVLGAIGIIVYSQSYGFMQLYNAPRMMGLAAISAILIGGATPRKAKISHVIIGTFLFQGVLVLGLPVASDAFQVQNLSEIMRIIITNGIIIYALTRLKGGASNG